MQLKPTPGHLSYKEPKEQAAETHTGAPFEHNFNKTRKLNHTLGFNKLKKTAQKNTTNQCKRLPK